MFCSSISNHICKRILLITEPEETAGSNNNIKCECVSAVVVPLNTKK